MHNGAEDQLHRLILDSLDEGVCTIDGSGMVTSFNRAAAALTGIPAVKALGRHYTTVIRSDSCSSFDLMRATLGSGENLTGISCTLLDHEERVVPVVVNTAAIRDDADGIIGAVATFRDNRAVELLRKELRDGYTRHDIVTKNPRMLQLLDLVPDLAASATTVLITGPTGTGKELYARAIHRSGPRAQGPFIAVNCGALPEALLEAELFGYRRGAFTDARQNKPGRFALAQGGTLFLDEVGELPPAIQVKLLRVLQEKAYEPLGSIASERTDARIIAATNRDLRADTTAGRFRDDLFYRLHVMPVELPALVARREDIPLLAAHFIERFNAEQDRAVRGLSAEAMAVLLRHDYPGNIRELENVIEHAFVICRNEEIGVEHLPRTLILERLFPIRSDVGTVPRPEDGPVTERSSLTAIPESDRIREMLSRHDGRRTAVAAELGIHPSTLWRKMKRYGLD